MKKSYTKIISVLITSLIFLSGCGGPTLSEAISSEALPPRNPIELIGSGDTFTIVDSTTYWYVVYCNKTKVMYAVSRGSSNRGSFTLLVNPDGTPMIWENSKI